MSRGYIPLPTISTIACAGTYDKIAWKQPSTCLLFVSAVRAWKEQGNKKKFGGRKVGRKEKKREKKRVKKRKKRKKKEKKGKKGKTPKIKNKKEKRKGRKAAMYVRKKKGCEARTRRRSEGLAGVQLQPQLIKLQRSQYAIPLNNFLRKLYSGSGSVSFLMCGGMCSTR